MADASSPAAAALRLVGLGPLMARTSGRPEIGVGLVDGPVAVEHEDFAGAHIRQLTASAAACDRPSDGACSHGTFVAGILAARRTSPAPGICAGCTLLVRPIFAERDADVGVPTAAAQDVADAIVECVDAGARILNLSAALGEPGMRAEQSLRTALDDAARRGAVLVAAVGNGGAIGSSEITRHPGVVPVVAYDLAGRPMSRSNFGRSSGRWGLGGPGEQIVSLATGTGATSRVGTSFAAAFVSGTIALLWSLFPAASAGDLRVALSHGLRRRTVVAPLMNAESAYRVLEQSRR